MHVTLRPKALPKFNDAASVPSDGPSACYIPDATHFIIAMRNAIHCQIFHDINNKLKIFFFASSLPPRQSIWQIILIHRPKPKANISHFFA